LKELNLSSTALPLSALSEVSHYPAEISDTWYCTVLAGTGARTWWERMAEYLDNRYISSSRAAHLY